MGLRVENASFDCIASTPAPLTVQLLHTYTSLAALNAAKADVVPAKCLPRKFAILLCGHASEYIRNTHGGVAVLITNMLGDIGEVWDTFRVVDGEFPPDERLCDYEGFIITGSYEDAHGSTPWVLQLCNVVREVYQMKKRLLGICFGHQVISRALGGKTGRATHGWELGLKKILLTDSHWSRSSTWQFPSSLHVLEAHQDEVIEVPPGGEVIASSPTTHVEIFAVGDQVLGVQGHPEFTEDIAFDVVHSYSKKHGIPEDVVAKAKLTLQDYKIDTYSLRTLCKSFLKAIPYRKQTFTHIATEKAIMHQSE